MRRKFIVAAAISVSFALVAGFVLANLAESQREQIKLDAYPISIKDETFTVTVETNWDFTPAPTVSVHDMASSTERSIELYFCQGKQGNVFYNITIPTALLSGNISLVWKYYLQNPDRYTLVNNGTCNSVSMNFAYDPHFSGDGYFEIKGIEVSDR